MQKAKHTILKASTVILSLGLSACTGVEPAMVFLATTSGVVMDDKLPTDYIAEAYTGEDCSYIRQLDDGGPLCRSADYGKVVEQPLYCYNTLGTVNCYTRPDPYGNGQTPVQ
ncbi:hypothetical protein [Curvivirga sp.]|uniref:hypothetical protein n=1 Tax=Curvivirga sp. TaxID=2856848 RepID=UPI003B5C13B9